MTIEVSPKALNLIRRALQFYSWQAAPQKHLATIQELIETFIDLEEQVTSENDSMAK